MPFPGSPQLPPAAGSPIITVISMIPSSNSPLVPDYYVSALVDMSEYVPPGVPSYPPAQLYTSFMVDFATTGGGSDTIGVPTL